MKRLLTKKQERALKLCHHDFDGLTQKAAAKIMGLCQQAVARLLERAEKALPQYFPIITKQEVEIYTYYAEGWSVGMISEHLGLTKRAVYFTLNRAKKKGMHFVNSKGRVLSFDQFRARFKDSDDEGIDTHIKFQF